MADEIESSACKLGTSVNEILEPLEWDEPAHADDARHGICSALSRRRKMFEIDSVVNAMNFRGGIRTALANQLAAVIGFSRDELRGGADFTKEIVTAEVLHEILPVRRDAEWNPGNFFQEKCGMRCAIGEMNVHMIHLVTREEVCEIEGIARALLCLDARPVFALVLLDQIARPSAGNLRVFF